MKKNNRVYFSHAGADLLDMPLYNKGNAFSLEERREFNLEGLLPYRIETIESQSARSYEQLCQLNSDLEKHIYLRDLQDSNETLFYSLLREHFTEILPIIYTPTVGNACELFSQIYRQSRGLFLSYPNRDTLKNQIWNIASKTIKVIVITDGERILGLGDLGTGGMGIPIGKLSIYTACGGISPAYTLPIYIDVGTNNENLLNDPMYIGWRHSRVDGDEYYNFLDKILFTLNERWPGVLIQFEDFAQRKATSIIKKYENKYCCFNDDIQGTAAVTLATLLNACKKINVPLKNHRILFVGAGSAATGIANLIAYQMSKKGMDLAEAKQNIFLCNSKGLVCENSPIINDFQKDYVKSNQLIKSISENDIPSMAQCVEKLKPTILIGVSGQKNVFNKQIVTTMLKNTTRPIIFPLSNPTSNSEARPADIIKWTKGAALVASGSPFEPIDFEGKKHHFSQCNNCFIFPGIGLGVVSGRPTYISPVMILEAAKTLADYPVCSDEGSLLPDINQVDDISKKIAFRLIKQAIKENLMLKTSDEDIESTINRNFWMPTYRKYCRTAF
ncbi:MAG: NAD-dependent malic enzyme [SAR324 cluster bacterium]|nr:NAD-dependent malic enzyme [SAR324 cluster bacterium]